MAENLTPQIFFLLLLGGFLPAILWLWFWLKEDTKKPEPRGWIILSFIVGAIAILPAFLLEDLASKSKLLIEGGLLLIVVWAAVEETVKFLAAYFTDFHCKAFNEPSDSMIYLITIALGFAALENTLFLFKGFHSGGVALSAVTAGMRFLGATLLHVLASGVLGGFIAFSYYKSKIYKIFYTIFGLVVAIALHAVFNHFIMMTQAKYTFGVFVTLWVGIVLLLLLFERVKKIKQNNNLSKIN